MSAGKRGICCIGVLAAAILGANTARAAGSDVADQSASASGTGGAGTARASDPGAAYFNPAALADGKGLRVGLGAVLAVPMINATAAAGAPGPAFDVGASRAARVIPNFGASYSDPRFTVGLSVHVPFGSGVSWPGGSALRFDSVDSSVRVFRIAPFVGARIGRVSFAAGPHIDIAELEARRATNQIVTEGSVHLLLRGVGYGAQAAIFARPTDEIAIGLSYKSRTLVPLSGDAVFDIAQPFAARFPDQGVTARLKLPDRIALGFAYSPERVRVLVDLTYTLWSFNDELHFQFERPETVPSTQNNQWRDTLAVRGGVEYDVTKQLTLRGGAFVDGLINPAAPSRTLSPSSPDMTRVGASLGAGWQFTRGVGVDVFYSAFALLERSSTSEDAILATYSGSAHILGLGARFAWDPSPPDQPRPKPAPQP